MRNSLTQHLRLLEEMALTGPAAPGRFTFGDGKYSIRVANDLESRRKAYRLVYRLYLEKEYAQPHPSKMWLSIFDALPETVTLLVERQAEGCRLKAEGTTAVSSVPSAFGLQPSAAPVPVGALTVVFDSPMGLPADKLYRPELDALRARGRRLCEFASLGVAEEGEGGSAVLIELFSCMSIYAQEVMGATDIVITVNPRHAGFYRRTLLFEDLGPERCYDKVGGAPAVLQRLDFDVQRESIIKEHWPQPEGARRSRVLYRLFHPLEDDAAIAAGLEKAARPMTERELGYFFVAETDILARAAPEQRAHLQECHLVWETAMEIPR
jgi:hypothetical protein